MDPLNNNSFGSSQVPGAIVSGDGTAVDNGGANSPTGGFSSPNFPSGGITVDNSSNQGPRKGLIVGVIVAFVLLLGGGLVALAAMNGVFGGGNSSSSSQEQGATTDAKSAFNEYVNYATSGENSIVAVNEETINNMSYPYFAELGGEELNAYLENIKKKSDVLGEYLGEDYAIALYDMDLYTLWFAEAYPIDYVKARNMYIADGYEKAVENINKHFEIDVEDAVFEQYLFAAREAAILEINSIQEADNAGCYADGKLISGCYSMSDEKKKEYDSARANEAETVTIIRENAIDAASSIYNSIYNSAETKSDE